MSGLEIFLICLSILLVIILVGIVSCGVDEEEKFKEEKIEFERQIEYWLDSYRAWSCRENNYIGRISDKEMRINRLFLELRTKELSNKMLMNTIEELNKKNGKVEKFDDSKAVVKNEKPSLLKSYKRREPRIIGFKYSVDDSDYLKQKLEELDAKCILINFLDSSMKIRTTNYCLANENEYLVAEGQYIVREDGEIKILNDNEFRKLYEKE